MLVDVVLPKWGLTMTEATVVRWLCAEGDAVEAGDALVEVETEKANAEVSAPSAGTVVRQVASVGAIVLVGDLLAVLESDKSAGMAEEPPAAATELHKADAPQNAELSPSIPTDPLTSIAQQPSGRASPLAKRIARELGVDVTTLRGTGQGGMVTESDVRAAAARPGGTPTGTFAADRIEKLSGMRKAIAVAMSQSLAQSAQLTLVRETSMEGALAVRESARDLGTTLTDVLLAAVGSTLTRHPLLNAHVLGDEVHFFSKVNIGLAVALENGLVTPVICDVPSLGLRRLTAERRRLVTAARSGALQRRDLEGGTFTVTNLGAYGIDAFTPILNPPEVAILGVGAVRTRPVMSGGGIMPAEQCTLSLTFDHRAFDGAPAALFLAELAALLGDRMRLEEQIG